MTAVRTIELPKSERSHKDRNIWTPNMDLRHVSSRALASQKLKGYEKRYIIYENLSVEDVWKMTDIDYWVMALPNGVAMPWIDAIKENGNNESLMIDLSADYRFDPEWTYGLPELCRPLQDR